MGTVTIILYLMSLVQAGTEALNSGKSELLSADEFLQNRDSLLSSKAKVLNEMMAGPLKGLAVTLVVEDDTDTTALKGVLEKVETPFYLLRLPHKIPEDVIFKNNLTEGLPPKSLNYTFETNSFPLEPSIIIILMSSDTPYWWLLWYPPKDWVTRTIVLVTASTSSSPEMYLKTPLLEKPSFLVVMCPYRANKPKTVITTPFRVWTWSPYAAVGRQLEDLGFWNPDSFGRWEDLFFDRFQDMSSFTLSVHAQTEDRPLIYITAEREVKGVNFLIIKELSRWLHFDTEYTTKGNILWTTLFDRILRGESDVFINYATITPERSAMFDLTVPYYREGFGILLEVPPPLPKWMNIIYPFTWPVWGAVAISLLSTSITYHILNYKDEKSFFTNFIFIMQSLLSNPMVIVPGHWRLRFFLLAWMIVSWFVNMSYTCNLIAVLTVPVFPTRLQTSEDLANSDYRLCMLDYGEFVDEALAASTHPVMSALFKILDMVPSYDDWEHIGEEQCIEKVLAGTHAHTETYNYVNIIYNKLGHGAKIYSFEEQLYPGYLAFLVRKQERWKYKFDDGIQHMLETGLVSKFFRDSMDDFKAYFAEESKSALVPLSLNHLQGPFLLYASGLILSTLVMFSEILFPSSQDTTPTSTVNIIG